MSRDLVSQLKDAITSPKLQPVLLAEFDFLPAPIRVWNGAGTISYIGNDYIGQGEFLGISEIAETADTAANGLSFSLTGVPAAMLSLVMDQTYQGRSCTLYLGVYDNGVIYATPLFSGKMDTITIQPGETGTITLNAENELINILKAKNLRYTDEDQKKLFPGDRGLEYVAGIQDKQIEWGKVS